MYLDTTSIHRYIAKDLIPWDRGTTFGKSIIQYLLILPKDDHIVLVFFLWSYIGSRLLTEEVEES